MRIGRFHICTRDHWAEARGFEVSWHGGRIEWAVSLGFGDAPRTMFRRHRWVN